MYYDDNIVLCGASAYEKKFYMNENFDTLPDIVKDELKAMCVLFTEDVGGVLTLVFDEEGNLTLNVTAEEDDILFDEIGSALKVKQLQQQKHDLFEALEAYYKVFFLGEELEDEE